MNYGWGAVGRDSLVAVLASISRGEKILADAPYAELWVGAHAKAPALVAEPHRRVEFSAWIERRYWRGTPLYRKHALPFLFKVLSVAAPLSIQAHPDKALAAKLHARDPANYRDANHKPELCCAVSRFEALCGFKPRAALVASVDACPELVGLVGRGRVDALRSAAGGGAARDALRASTARSCVLAPGEAIFLPAGEPHAYLKGDCVEAMACSDNVVRAGLTPKFKDVDVLCDMLSYGMGPPAVLPPAPTKTLYAPPVPEFRLLRLELAAGEAADLPPTPSFGVLVCVSGAAICVDSADHRYALRTGATTLVLPDTTLTLTASAPCLLFCCQEQVDAAADEIPAQ
ncbi:Mannose phosphate isomerase [Aureococcus anophagefferens]|nr:Mannose phosphate isomerase [Aureococcus anophagefferens]